MKASTLSKVTSTPRRRLQAAESKLVYAKHSLMHERKLGGAKGFFGDELYSRHTPLESPGHALILSIDVTGKLLCRVTELAIIRRMAYYLSSSPRRNPERLPKYCFFGYIASQGNILTYQAKHRSDSCTCQIVLVDAGEESEPAGWIRSRHMPLIIRTHGSTSG